MKPMFSTIDDYIKANYELWDIIINCIKAEENLRLKARYKIKAIVRMGYKRGDIALDCFMCQYDKDNKGDCSSCLYKVVTGLDNEKTCMSGLMDAYLNSKTKEDAIKYATMIRDIAPYDYKVLHDMISSGRKLNNIEED